MTTDSSSQNKKTPCDKFIQMMRNIVKLSSFPFLTTNVQSDTNSYSPPHRDHTSVNVPKDQSPKREYNRHLDGLGGEGSSSFIKVQGINHDYIGRQDDVDGYKGMQTSSALKTSIANLKAADYIRRFHERNKHESVSLVLPPPPPPLPRLPQDKFLLK